MRSIAGLLSLKGYGHQTDLFYFANILYINGQTPHPIVRSSIFTVQSIDHLVYNVLLVIKMPLGPREFFEMLYL